MQFCSSAAACKCSIWRAAGAHLVVNHKGHIASLLAGDEAIKQDGQATDEGLCYGARASLGHDDITRHHPLLHVVNKALDEHIHTLWILPANAGTPDRTAPQAAQCTYDQANASHVQM